MALTLFALLATPAGADEAQPVVFDIERYEIEGNTLLNADELRQATTPFTGKRRDFGDVQRALEAVEVTYRGHGYGAVQVYLPEQELEKGTVKLRVIEARIGSVLLVGNSYFDKINVRASLPSIKEGTTPNARQISENLRAVNESPAKQTNVVLKPGANDGEVDVVVQVKDENPHKVFASLDNTGSGQTGRLRAGFGYQHANVANRDQVLTLQYSTSVEKPDQVRIFGAGYHIPLYGLGDSVDLFAGDSSVDSGSAGGLFTVSGSGLVLGARYNKHFPRSDDYEHKLIAGVDHRAYETTALFNGTDLVPDYAVHPLSLTYAGKWAPTGRETTFQVAAAVNVPGGKNGHKDQIAAARAGADASYRVMRYGFTHAQSVAGDWQVRLAASGQHTRDALVPGEQFGVGGANSVRGFDEREIAGDTGYSGSAEVYTPDVGGALGAGLRGLVFYDFGQVRDNPPARAGTPGKTSASSAGLGLRLNVGKAFNLRVDYARVAHGGGIRPRGSEMLHMGAVYVY